MPKRDRSQNDMPDVPEPDLIDTVCELWNTIACAAYHLAYIRVYTQTEALQTHVDALRRDEQISWDMAQADVVICRAHLAAFFWQLDHVFEALQISIKRGQKERPDSKYFWSYEKRLEQIEQTTIRQEINFYRNKAHEMPAIIGCRWEKGGTFLHHFLPSIRGQQQQELGDLNNQLQQYFEYAVNEWLHFLPDHLKSEFPRSFKFVVSVPHYNVGELPPELKGAPQLEVSVVASDHDKEN